MPAKAEHQKDFGGGDVEILVAFKSGHYKSFVGEWLGDYVWGHSVWGHFRKKDGRIIHINKDEVEYIETSK